ncbi:MAG: allophanate hydrolase [Thioalkalivibrionaceae bacterium]
MAGSSLSSHPQTVSQWQAAYRQDRSSAFACLREAWQRIDPEDPTWISVLDRDGLEREIERLAQIDPHLPLFGVPFAVKDNIDAAGWETTAACPAYAYRPARDAAVVERLRAAGAVLFGKTNLDQFATGLVGTRSPYGVPVNPFAPERVPGGSSSGSAVAVARGLVAFALGTDTAGSGRVPAAFNNLVGLKPSRGLISTRGVVPACASLDCVSIFALTEMDASQVLDVAAAFDPEDPWSRRAQPRPPAVIRTLAIPETIDWHGDSAQEQAWHQACAVATAQDWTLVTVDYTPLEELADLLYRGPWVAERTAAVGDFITRRRDAIHPTVAAIIDGGRAFDGVDFARAIQRRQALLREIEGIFERCDALFVPSAPRYPLLVEDAAEPIAVNTTLGRFTNFVNLADLCALALPSGWRHDGLPFGVTVIAPGFSESPLAGFARRWRQAIPATLGCSGQPVGGDPADASSVPSPPGTLGGNPPSMVSASGDSGSIELAVVGAHLRGQPLEHQLTSRAAVFVEATITASCYRLYALPDTTPSKPGLARTPDDAEGHAIAVEVWRLSPTALGALLAEVPPPLGIGSIELADGRWVRGFICEGYALEAADDISRYGGWRNYLDAVRTAPAKGSRCGVADARAAISEAEVTHG